jgi:uncharacterized protein (DUF2141 family)
MTQFSKDIKMSINTQEINLNSNKLTQLLLTSILCSSLCFTSSVFAADIYLGIEGVNAQYSKIYAQLFNSQDSYSKGYAFSATYLQAKQGINTVIFTNVPIGQYAIRFFQDENNNGKLDTNLFGIPSEGYGFSNNAKPNYGPVGYQDAAFTVTEQQAPVINKTHIIY